MTLEERVRGAWQSVQDAAGKKDEFAKTCRALCQLLNVPPTSFNQKTALELVQKKEPVETFIKVSDRYPPSFDLDTEDKFRAYIDTYRRIRKDLGPDDILAILRLSPTADLRQRASAWLEGKAGLDWAKAPTKK